MSNMSNCLISGIKNATEVNLKLSSKMAGNSNNVTNFPYKILLTNAQVSTLYKAFADGS